MLHKIQNIFLNPMSVPSTPWDNHVKSFHLYTTYDVEFGKTYYIPFRGSLRAVKFVSLVKDYGSDTYFTYLNAKVAGIDGLVAISPHSMYDDRLVKYMGAIYESVEDYNNRTAIDTINIEMEKVFMYVFGDKFTYLCANKQNRFARFCNHPYEFAAMRYKWDGTKVIPCGEEVAHRFNGRFEIFPNGEVLLGSEKKPLEFFDQLFNDTYATYEECQSANAVQVVEFDDEIKPVEERTYQVTLQLTKEELSKVGELGIKVPEL